MLIFQYFLSSDYEVEKNRRNLSILQKLFHSLGYTLIPLQKRKSSVWRALTFDIMLIHSSEENLIFLWQAESWNKSKIFFLLRLHSSRVSFNFLIFVYLTDVECVKHCQQVSIPIWMQKVLLSCNFKVSISKELFDTIHN